jgi:hypothetical protein
MKFDPMDTPYRRKLALAQQHERLLRWCDAAKGVPVSLRAAHLSEINKCLAMGIPTNGVDVLTAYALGAATKGVYGVSLYVKIKNWRAVRRQRGTLAPKRRGRLWADARA